MEGRTTSRFARALFACLPLLVSCTYPEFQFRGDASADTFFEGDTSVDDAVDDVRDDALVDTEQSATDAVADVTTDAKTDAAKDTGVDAPDAAPTGCAAITADFCDDWNSVSSPSSKWTYQNVASTGAIALESGGVSPPKAFSTSVSMGATTSDVITAMVLKELTAPAPDTKLRADVWIKLDSATFPGGSDFLLKVQRTGDGVTFSIDSGGFFVDAISMGYARWPVPKAVPVGKWFHVRLEARLKTVGGELAVFIDDMTTPLVSKTGISTASVDDTSRTFIVGQYAQGLTGSFKAHYDDASLVFLP